MGTANLSAIVEGQTVKAAFFNALRAAMLDTIVPRTNGGIVAARTGSVGAPFYRWLRMYVTAGDWSPGDLKSRHSFGGETEPGQGWMLCDGRIITEANYDAEHGAGSWATYCSDSPLVNKYLPDFANRLPVGDAATTQDGSAPITAVGIAGSVVNLEHTHQWLRSVAGENYDRSYDASGSLVDLGPNQAGSYSNPAPSLFTPDNYASNNKYAEKKLDANQSILPDSIETQFYMRIV